MEQTTINCPACHNRVGVPREADDAERRCPDCDAPLDVPSDNPAFEKTVLKGDGSTWGGDGPSFEVRREGTEPSEDASPTPPEELQIPGFELLAELGRGGMGVVYKARQLSLNRIVAIKMIRAGLTAGDEERRRFQAEAEAVAQLQHPHIVQVYEVGEAHGQPFFVLEYVEGTALDRRLDEGPLAPEAAAELVVRLSEAMEAAHRKGIVHRDLKPGNVLLAYAESMPSGNNGSGSSRSTPPGPPFARGGILVPKITDFGLAKRIEDRGQTQTGQILGTPNYMAPEQAAGESRNVGAPADVYALGAILYSTLTGRPPFVGETVIETIEFVRNNEPVSPRQLRPGVPRDLETICLKCLRKDPAKRYQSADALAADLLRYLNGEAIHARPVGVIEKGVKWAKRRKALAGFLVMFFVALPTFIVFLLTLNQRLASTNAELTTRNEELDTARRRAVDESVKKEQARADEFVARIDAQRQNYALTIRQIFELQRIINPNMERARDLHVALKPGANDVDFRSFEWHYLNRILHAETEAYSGYAAGFDREDTLVLGARDHLVWTRRGGIVRQKPLHRDVSFFGALMSPDAKRIAIMRERPSNAGPTNFEVGWSAIDNLQEVTVLGRFERRILPRAAWSHDASHLALINHASSTLSNPRAHVRVWRIADGRKVADIAVRPKKPASGIALSRDGRYLAVGSYDRNVYLYTIADGQLIGTIRSNDARGVHAVAFSPQGDRLCTAGTGGTIEEWDVAKRTRVAARRVKGMSPSCIRYSPDGRQVGIGTFNTIVLVLDVRRGKLRTYRGHKNGITRVLFSRDGKRLVSSAFRETRVWDTTESATYDQIDHFKDVVDCVGYSPDGRSMVYGTAGEFSRKHPGVIVRDAESRKIRHRFPNLPMRSFDFTPDGRWMIVGSAHDNDAEEWRNERGTATLIDFQAGRIARRISVPKTRILQTRFLSNDELLLGCEDGTIRSYRISTKQMSLIMKAENSAILSMAVSRTRRVIFTRSLDAQVKGWDLETRKPTFSYGGNLSPHNIATSPDGRMVAVPAPDPLFVRDTAGAILKKLSLGRETPEHENHILVVDIRSGQRVVELAGHSGQVRCIAFTADAKRLASGSADSSIKIWDIATKHELMSLQVGMPLKKIAFSPDNRELICATVDGRVLRFGRSNSSR